MYNLIKEYRIAILFYLTIILLFVSMVFARLVSEPYPSLNMPAFTRSGINEGVLPASYFEVIYLNNEDEVWKGDLKEIFNPVNLIRYRNNMHFVFFNQVGTNLEESKKQKGRIISLIPGGQMMHETLKDLTTNEMIGTPEKLMYRKKPFESEEVTGFIVNEYKEYYHLVDGFQYREIVKHKEFKFNDDSKIQ